MPFYVYEYYVLFLKLSKEDLILILIRSYSYISIRYALRSNVVNGFIYVIGIYINIVILKGSPIDGFGFTPQQMEIGVIIAP